MLHKTHICVRSICWATFVITVCFVNQSAIGQGTAKVETVQAFKFGSVSGQFFVDGDGLSWSVRFDGKQILQKSPLKLFWGKSKEPCQFRFVSRSTRDVSETWSPTFGQQSSVLNRRRDCTWHLQDVRDPSRTVDLVMAVFDDAIGVRFRPSKSTQPFSDRTGFKFAGDFTFWSANGERPNHGPIKMSQWNKGKIQAPMTIQVADDCYCALLESSIFHQYPYSIHRAGGPTQFETRTFAAKFSGGENGEATAWRVLSFGRSPGDLIENQVLGNLAPPLAIEDASWVKPGLALWDWRAWGATAPDGFQYGLDMESWKRFIDFAASKKNVRYLLVDADWYGPEGDSNQDPTTSRDYMLANNQKGKMIRVEAPDDWANPIDMPALIEYGNERGVGVVLYINDHARKKFDFEETLATYQKWGAAGIKFGFMKTKGNEKVRQTRKIVELCAKYKLVCDFHDGPIPGSGDTRTYPNYLTREFCHAQADGHRSFSPETFCTSVFVNMLTGALDMSNGLYAIKDAEKVRPRIFEQVKTTAVGETARNLICFSGMATIPDIPEAYEAKSDLFTFIESMPMTWDETKVLNGQIGDHITIARRAGDKWLIGSACDENGAVLPIDLSFLEDGKSYRATVYEDAADTHFESNPEAYSIRKMEVKKGDQLEAKLAPGGGHCILIE